MMVLQLHVPRTRRARAGTTPELEIPQRATRSITLPAVCPDHAGGRSLRTVSLHRVTGPGTSARPAGVPGGGAR